MLRNPQFPADLVIFTEEILNGKFHFFSSADLKQAIMCEKYYVKYFMVFCTMFIAKKTWKIYVFHLRNITFARIVRRKIDSQKIRIFSRGCFH